MDAFRIRNYGEAVAGISVMEMKMDIVIEDVTKVSLIVMVLIVVEAHLAQLGPQPHHPTPPPHTLSQAWLQLLLHLGLYIQIRQLRIQIIRRNQKTVCVHGDAFAKRVSFGAKFIIILPMNMTTSVFLMIDVSTIRSAGPMNTSFQSNKATKQDVLMGQSNQLKVGIITMQWVIQ